MTKRELVTSVISLAVVLVAAVVWFLAKPSAPATPGSVPVGGGSETPATAQPATTPTLYKPSVPQGATLTTPTAVAPASGNASSDAKARFLTLQASASGFSPATITVKRGDTVYVDFTAVDGTYDLSIPYLGAAFNAVPQGTTKRLPFDTDLSGTFTFECSKACPASGSITGDLVVLP